MKLLHRQFIFLVLALNSLQSFSQYSLKGVVVSNAHSEKLSGAIVKLKKKGLHERKTITNDAGIFQFTGLQPAQYELEVEFIAYATFDTLITVGNTREAFIVAGLQEKNHSLQDVNVFSTLNKENEASSRSAEKKAGNIINVISAEAMQRSPDINAANVLQRMSGITLQKKSGADESYAIVRGLEPRYNNTLINGVKITSPDEKARSVALDIVPSDLLQKIEVSKSLLPEMEGDAIGGTVNLVMKDAPDTAFFAVTGALGYSNIFFNRKYTSFSTKDIQQKSLNERYGSNYKAQSTDFSRSNLDFKQKKALPTGTTGITYGKRLLNNRLGFIISDNFQNQYYGSNVILNSVVPDIYLAIPAISDVAYHEFSTQQLNNGLVVHADYHFNDRNKIAISSVLLYSYLQQARESVDTAIKGGNGGRTVPGSGPVSTTYTSLSNHSLLENVKLEGKHILSSHLLFDWAGVYSLATKRSPDRAELSVNKKIDTVHTTNDISGPYTFRTTPDYFDDIARIWQHNQDQDLNVLANLDYKTSLHNILVDIKAGGLYRHKTRYNLQDDYDLKPTTNSNGVKQVFTDINHADWVVYNPAGTYDYDVNNYHAFENITAGYVQAKISKSRLDLFGGLRIENTSQGFTINTFYQNQVNGVKKQYTDMLPSVMLRYKLSSKSYLRASYFKSISRPNYYELVPYLIKSATTAIDERGNPDLKHAIANSFDVRYELYPHTEEQIFIGGFYKKIQSPIEYAYINGTTYQPVNLGDATLYGAELVLTKYIGSFGVTGNYTYIYSSIYSTKSYTDLQARTTYDKLQQRPMQGQTDHTANFSVLYKEKKGRYFLQAAYNYTGKTLWRVYPIYGYDYYQQPQSFLSFSGEYMPAKKITLFAKFNNLLNTATNYRINTLLVGKEVFNSNFLIGIRYKN